MLGKSQSIVFFQCFARPEGRKIGSLNRRPNEKMTNCAPLWREARFDVKVQKITMFGLLDTFLEVKKLHALHAVVARSTQTSGVRTTFGRSDAETICCEPRSTFSSQNAQSTTFPHHFFGRSDAAPLCR